MAGGDRAGRPARQAPRIQLTPVYFGEPAPAGIIAVLQDLTQRRSLTAELQSERERRQVAEEVAGLGYWEVDLDSGRVALSEGARRLLGCPHSPATSLRELLAHFDAADRPHIVAALGRASERGVAEYECDLHAQDGVCRRLLMRDAGDLERLEQTRSALADDRLVLHAQPIVELGSGEIVGRELLVRLRDEEGRIVPPSDFLPVAERLERTGADPALVVFEVTETALMADVDRGRVFATAVRELGCRFALDDFGTGYGTFTYLKHIPIDYLKIDIEFVRDLLNSQEDERLVRAIVAMARDLGKTTIAEGVENGPTLERLRELGVDQAQGYHIGRPAELHLPGRPAAIPVGAGSPD